MKDFISFTSLILKESYKSIYLFFISIIWMAAIGFAIIQNGYMTQLIIKTVLSDEGVHVRGVTGGIFGVVSIDDIRYKESLRANSLIIKINPFELLEKKLVIDMLDINSLQIDSTKLAKDFEDTNSTQVLDTISAKLVKISINEHRFGEFVLKKSEFALKNLIYEKNRLLFDYSATFNSNIINARAEGLFKDFNYSAKGTLKASGDNYINKLADDIDFDFNALKETEFSLRGDDENISADFNIKNSGIFYKYGVDSKIVNVLSNLSYNLKTNNFLVSSKGQLDCRYGTVESQFDISYNGTVNYKGNGAVSKFSYIPLGVFSNDIKVLNANNASVDFNGDIHKLVVKIGQTTAHATLKNEPIEIKESQSLVEYDFDKEILTVGVKATASTRFGDMLVDTNVIEDDRNFTSFNGNVIFKNGKNEIISADQFNSLKANFNGDENQLKVEAYGDKTGISVNSNGYKTFQISAEFDDRRINQLFTTNSKLSSMTISASAQAVYDSEKDAISLHFKPKKTMLFGQDIKLSSINIFKSPHEFKLDPFDFELGQLKGQAGSKKDEAKGFFVNATGIDIDTSGNLIEPTKFRANIDFSRSNGWLFELFEVRKNTFAGNIDIQGSIDSLFDNPKISANISSKYIKAFDFDLKNIQANFDINSSDAKISKLAFEAKEQKYTLTKTPTISKTNNGFNMGEFAINDTIYGKAEKKDGSSRVDFTLKKHIFYDEKLAKMLLNGSGWIVHQDDKNYINAQLIADDVELFYYPKSAKITKDRDIKIVNKKAPPKLEEEFVKNTYINIKLDHLNSINYKTKDITAKLNADLIYYKDFNKKANLVGLIKLSPNGSYNLEGRKFKIVSGEIVLIDGENDNPFVDITLRLDESDITIFVGAKGFASSPKLTFWSNPALSERELMSYLVFGIDDEFGFGKNGVKSDYTAKAIGALSNTLSRNVANELGIKLDKIEVSPSTHQKEGKNISATKVEVGKKVTKDLTVIYKNDVESSVSLQYRLNKNFGIETESKAKGNSIDLFYKQDY